MDKHTFASYSQFGEDIILMALLYDVEKGFYMDVGANHESYHSVTKLFYDNGWSGINIEPIPRLIKQFEAKRERDINLNVAIAEDKSDLVFREYKDHDGFSTFSEEMKIENEKRGIGNFKDYMVEVMTLDELYKKNDQPKVDFLKIDVEGFEEHVIRSSSWKQFRPTVICVEANHRSSDWSKLLTDNGYTKVIFDGLNEYYLASESKKMMDGFAERAAILMHNAVNSHHFAEWTELDQAHRELVGRLKESISITKRLEEDIARHVIANQQLEKFSSIRYQIQHLVKSIDARVFRR